MLYTTLMVYHEHNLDNKQFKALCIEKLQYQFCEQEYYLWYTQYVNRYKLVKIG